MSGDFWLGVFVGVQAFAFLIFLRELPRATRDPVDDALRRMKIDND